jgi:TIR domain/Pentapeptide repeats (8 copies)
MANRNQINLIRQGVADWNHMRKTKNEFWPDLVGADLSGLDLTGIDFYTADLRDANLSNCNLSYADFTGSILIRTDLSNCSLQNANFYIANLTSTKLSGSDVSYSIMGVTILVNNDLSEVKGLESVQHVEKSHIGVDTIQKSKGKIHTTILNNCGVTEEMQEYLSLFQQTSINYYSCFISYSSIDEIFVRKFYEFLTENKIKCWFAPEDMKIGDKIRPAIDSAINLHDKVLLVISSNSISSQWVEQEVEKALERERKENRLILFPIAIDSSIFGSDIGWASFLKNTRNIAFYENWSEANNFVKISNRIVTNLKAN